jgi:hypothetical protein
MSRFAGDNPLKRRLANDPLKLLSDARCGRNVAHNFPGGEAASR